MRAIAGGAGEGGCFDVIKLTLPGICIAGLIDTTLARPKNFYLQNCFFE